MNSAIKFNLKLKMQLAHCIAKQLSGDYSARMSFVLRLISKAKDNTYGFDSNTYAYGVNKYWLNMAAFLRFSDDVITFVENEMIDEPKKALIWWYELTYEQKNSKMVNGLFGRNFNSLNEMEIKYLYRNA